MKFIERALFAGVALILILTIIALLGWHAYEMLLAATSIGVLLVMSTALRLRRQVRSGQVTQNALRDVEARVSGIVESAMDAIITVDEKQRIVMFNAAAEDMFGCPREQAMGIALDWFIPDRYRAAHSGHVRRFSETGVGSRRMGASRIIMGLRRNGEEFPVDASISQIAEHGTKFYTVILRDVTERVRTEEALRRSREELREMASVSHLVREQEKSRIARELHDELGQAMTALKMDVNWVSEQLPEGTDLVRRKLERMLILLDSTVTATRRISAELRPLILDDLGVIAAVEWLVENFTQRTGVICELEVSDAELTWEDPLSTAIFRIVQESLTNIARHAKATRTSISIAQTNTDVLISVTDNGAGFSQKDDRKPSSFGLLGLRERANLLGGEADIVSAPGKGTRIEVRLPLPAAEVES